MRIIMKTANSNALSHKLLTIDLSSQKYKISPVNANAIKKYLGGRALGAYLYSKNVRKPTDAKNSVFIMPGLLTGSNLFSVSRSEFVTSSAKTGLLVASSFGGFFGAYLRMAGYSGLEITGKAKELTYAVVIDNKVQFYSATFLKGKSPAETRARLLEKHKDITANRAVSVVSIGLAGENLVKYASTFFDDRVAGRSGTGWHFGFKNLKALVFIGDIKPYTNSAFNAVVKESVLKKNEYEKQNGNDHATAPYISYANETQTLPASNYKRNFVEDNELKQLDAKEYYKKVVKKTACWTCPLACTRFTKGKFNNEEVKGPEYETLWSLGANLDNFDLDVVIEANRLCDTYGLDTISTGGVLGWYKECVDSQLIDDTWSVDRMFELIRLIAENRDIGKKLSGGVVNASIEFGVGSDKIAHSKGLELPAWDPRVSIGMALGYAVAPTGGDHCKQWTVEEDTADPKTQFNTKDKAQRVLDSQLRNMLGDALGLCMFAEFLYDYKTATKLINAYLEADFTEAQLRDNLMEALKLERAINRKLGHSHKDDVLPPRIIGYPVLVRGKEFVLTQDMFDEMKQDYYRLMGEVE